MPKSFNSGKSFGIVQTRDKIIDGTQIKAAGLFINSSLNYKTAPAEKPGQGGFPFAFWQLLHYITVQSIDRDARIGISNSEFCFLNRICKIRIYTMK